MSNSLKALLTLALTGCQDGDNVILKNVKIEQFRELATKLAADPKIALALQREKNAKLKELKIQEILGRAERAKARKEKQLRKEEKWAKEQVWYGGAWVEQGTVKELVNKRKGSRVR